MRFVAMPRALLVVALGLVSFGALSAASAQDATPVASPAAEQVEVTLIDVNGSEVGTAVLTESAAGVTFTVDVTGLPPGEHGIHVHEIGVCNPNEDDPFSTAGDHFNPTGAPHGGPPAGAGMGTPMAGHDMTGTPMAGDQMSGTPGAGMDAHAGDLGNITVGEDGTGHLEITTNRVTLQQNQDNSLPDEDGSALLIHENPDDLTTQPSGNSGGRIACGVIFEPMNPAVVATPEMATPEMATPEA